MLREFWYWLVRIKREMRKNNGKYVLAAVFLLLGAGFLAFPFVREAYQNQKQQEMLNQWWTGLLQLEVPVGEASAALEAEAAEEREVVGILEIAAIDLSQPILKGATKANLSYSLATLEPTDVPGEIGNFVVTGHNSRTYGRHFNRLHEVKTGDIVEVVLRDRTVSFVVDSIQVIEDKDIWIADSDKETSRITLITCYYAEDRTTKRLAVQGHKR